MKKQAFWLFILIAELVAILDAFVLSFYANRLLEAYFFAIFIGVAPTVIIGGLLWIATRQHRGYSKRDKIVAIVLLLLNAILLYLMIFGSLRVADLTMMYLMTGYLLFAVFTPAKSNENK